MSIDDLETEALKLAPKDRAKLAGELLESLEDLSPPAGANPAADVLSKARSWLK